MIMLTALCVAEPARVVASAGTEKDVTVRRMSKWKKGIVPPHIPAFPTDLWVPKWA